MRSVRARTTVTAVVVFALAVAGATAALLVVLRQSLIDEVDRSIDARAADIAAQIDVGNEIISIGAGFDATTLAVVFDLEGGFYDSTDDSLDPLDLVDAFDTFDEPFDLSLPGLTHTEGADNLRAVALFTDYDPLSSTAGGLVEVGEEDLITVVATSLDGVDRTVSRVRNGALVGAPLLVALVGILTWWLAGRALGPVDTMRREVDDIRGSDLTRRVAAPASRDEIARLATTMNAMLDRIEDSAARQRRFVSDAAHELRSPLASLRARLEVELRQPDPEWDDVGAAAVEDTARMQRLVDDLLLLARSDDGSLPMRPTLVDLDDVVFEVVGALDHGDTQVDTTGVSAGLVHGDADHLRRVVVNLVDNALRYADRQVAVTVVESDDRVMCFVDDDGPGVPAEQRDEVVQRFVRLDDARSRNLGGAGLGLAISSEIVAAHDGRLAVGEGPLGGARVGFELPAHRPNET